MGSSSFPMLRLAAAIILSAPLFAQTTVVPTTTLAQETANNTSTANTFQAQDNGNLGPSNISKLPVSSLLYPGANTQIYAHLMGWFGSTSHMNVGYNSSDPAQVHKQLNDMISRSISGAILDWYGPGDHLVDAAAQALRHDAEGRGGAFSFAIMEDGGALKSCSQHPGCDVTQNLINDLNYASQQYVVSGAYLRSNGRPVFFFFGTEAYTIDWTRARNGVTGNPLFIFRNDSGFSQQQTAGGFAWLSTAANPQDPMSLHYLDDFYHTAVLHPTEVPFGSAYKGFNDELAPWGSHRFVTQNCGQTWMQSMAQAATQYSANHQLPWLQLVTWNDYEEATALEMGIDNCVALTPSVTTGWLNWSVAGSESTIDHYSVFISLDGQNLMKVTDVATGNHSLNIASYNFVPGNYLLYVEAIGKATLTNKMSAAVPFSMVQPLSVSVSAPANGASTNLMPVVTATAADGNRVNSLQIYVDNTLVGQGNSNNLTVTASVTPGAHTITARATDAIGGTASQSSMFTAVNQPPHAALSVAPLTTTIGVPVTGSTAGSYDPDGNSVTSTIDWGDGNRTSGATGSHVYITQGAFTVTARVTDAYGATTMATQTVTVGAVRRIMNVTSPQDGESTARNVPVIANAQSPYGVVAMQIYVDGVLVFQQAPENLNQNIRLREGPHYVVVQAWDGQGATWKSGAHIVAGNHSPDQQPTN